MSTLTVRIPDDKHQRLRDLARQRGISVNRLLDEVVTAVLVERDAEVRFAIRSERGKGREGRGLALLEKAARTRGPAGEG